MVPHLSRFFTLKIKCFGDNNDSLHKQSNLDSNSKDGDYRDHGDDEADDNSAMDLGGKRTGV